MDYSNHLSASEKTQVKSQQPLESLQTPNTSTKSELQSRTNQISSKINSSLSSPEQIKKSVKVKEDADPEFDQIDQALMQLALTKGISHNSSLPKWRQRDMELVKIACQRAGFQTIEDFAKSDERFGKLSRREIVDLTHSYFISPEGHLMPIYHKKNGGFAHQFSDTGEKIFLGQGGFKKASRIGDGWVKLVVHRRGANMESAIAATKEEAFKKCEYLMVGHYVIYKSKRTGEIKEAFLVPEMSGDIGNKKFSVYQIINIYLNIAKGLKVMHDHDWAHRDIKPANILFRDKNAKLADMDLAINLKTLNRKHSISGTRGYISPEMLLGKCKDSKGYKMNDIFALGVSILESIGFKINKEEKFSHISVVIDLVNFMNLIPNEPVDSKLKLLALSSLAVKMIKENPTHRPDIDGVISGLEFLINEAVKV